MRIVPSFLRAIEFATAVNFSISATPSCGVGHPACFNVVVVSSMDHAGSPLKKYLGPYRHLELQQALDVVAVLSAQYGSALELIDQRRALEEMQMTLDLEE